MLRGDLFGRRACSLDKSAKELNCRSMWTYLSENANKRLTQT
jgi:hypothetical protein